MIISDEEFYQQCASRKLSRLQVAYLLFVGILPPALRCKSRSGKWHYLFDDNHLIVLDSLLTQFRSNTISEIRDSNNYTTFLNSVLDQPPGLSGKVIAELESITKSQESIGKGFPNADLEDFLAKNFLAENIDSLTKNIKQSLHLRLWRYFKRFRLFKIKITGKQQIEFIIQQTIITAILPSKVTEYFFFRLRPIRTNIRRDQCLKQYVYKYWLFGWGGYDEELEVIGQFFKLEPALLTWSIERVLDYISSIEDEYVRVTNQVHDYLASLDPEGRIIKLIAFQLLDPSYKALFAEVAESLERSSRKSNENLIKIGDIVSKVVKIFIEKS
jgi:hypothetical protein